MNRKPVLSIIFISVFLILLAGCAQPKTIDAKEVITKENVQEWDLLWISDSSGWGVVDIYAGYVAEDLGIEINVNDQWMGGLAAGEVLASLNGEPNPNLDLTRMSEYIKEAEIIVFYGNPELSKSTDNPWDWNCGQGMEACDVNSCDMETFDLYIEHIKEIYSIIHTLRKGQPTIIRAFDAYNPAINRRCTQHYDECLQCWENYNKAIHMAADEMGVPVANVFDAWNGPDHTQDPNDKGYTWDGEHPSEKGAEVIANLVRGLGYEMVIP